MMGATARSSGNVDDFVRDFSARIVSLADTHSMLTDDYWQTASLHKLLEGELRHYETGDGRGYIWKARRWRLSPTLPIPVGMAFP